MRGLFPLAFALFALGQFTTVAAVYGDNAECTATRWGHGVAAS